MSKKKVTAQTTDFERAVYSAARKIPLGKVSTYGATARATGRPGAARAVGNALNKNPYAPDVPCHRVVMSDGRLGGFARGSIAKMRMLRREGIKITKGKIDNFEAVLFEN